MIEKLEVEVTRNLVNVEIIGTIGSQTAVTIHAPAKCSADLWQ